MWNENASAKQLSAMGANAPTLGNAKGNISISMQRVDNGIIIHMSGFNPPESETKEAYEKMHFQKQMVATDYMSACNMIHEFLSRSLI